MKRLIWVGTRESDIAATGDLFESSITIYGSNAGTNISYSSETNIRANHNVPDFAQAQFIAEKQSLLSKDACFMFYNPITAFTGPTRLLQRTCCLNNHRTLQLMNNKITFRRWAEQIVPTHKSDTLRGAECSFNQLANRYGEHAAFIVQSSISGGGYGTNIIRRSLENSDCSNFSKDEFFLVSPYVNNNIPINMHAIIFEDEILVFPGSIQLMLEHNGRLLYRGADYIKYNDLDSDLRLKFIGYVRQLCLALQHKGYRGICGVDAMIVEENVLIFEINSRFQASTPLINTSLVKHDLPSINELNLLSFQNLCPAEDIASQIVNITVPYSSYSYIGGDNPKHINNIFNNTKKNPDVFDLVDDGYDPKQTYVDEAYLFKLVLKKPIAICSDNKVVVDSAITGS